MEKGMAYEILQGQRGRRAKPGEPKKDDALTMLLEKREKAGLGLIFPSDQTKGQELADLISRQDADKKRGERIAMLRGKK